MQSHPRIGVRIHAAILFLILPQLAAAAVLVSNGFPSLSTQPGVVFFDRTFVVSYLGGPAVLAGSADGTQPISVDDQLEVTVTHTDGSTTAFTHDFSQHCTGVAAQPPQDIRPLLVPGANLVRVRFRDLCGGAVSASAHWLVGVDPPPSAGATWRYRPRQMRDVWTRGRVVVVARVTSVTRGATIGSGDLAMPTEVVDLAVERTLKGSRLTAVRVFHTGSGDRYADGDPPYRIGERWLLALRRQKAQRGVYLPVSPEGRYRVEADDTVSPAMPEGMSNDLRGLALRDAAERLRGAPLLTW
jgi:hypothetical protein